MRGYTREEKKLEFILRKNRVRRNTKTVGEKKRERDR
jgi:hypothetical protein